MFTECTTVIDHSFQIETAVAGICILCGQVCRIFVSNTTCCVGVATIAIVFVSGQCEFVPLSFTLVFGTRPVFEWSQCFETQTFGDEIQLLVKFQCCNDCALEAFVVACSSLSYRVGLIVSVDTFCSSPFYIRCFTVIREIYWKFNRWCIHGIVKDGSYSLVRSSHVTQLYVQAQG